MAAPKTEFEYRKNKLKIKRNKNLAMQVSFNMYIFHNAAGRTLCMLTTANFMPQNIIREDNVAISVVKANDDFGIRLSGWHAFNDQYIEFVREAATKSGRRISCFVLKGNFDGEAVVLF